MTSPATDATDRFAADSGDAPGKSRHNHPFSSDSEALAADVEAVLMASGRALPAVRIAVALGLISAEADPAELSAARPGGQVVEDGSGDQSEAGGEHVREAKPTRRKGTPRPDEPGAVSMVEGAIRRLNDVYEKTGRSFRIERISGGYRFMTLARHARAVASVRQDRDQVKMSRQAIETLAIIAYRQPVTRAELEAIRGVSSGEVVRSLMERRLVAIVGRSEELGRPMLYGTTKHFLDAFGLATLRDLPSAAELKSSL
ncbi:MAG: SMC-Scp complex subunit ScpB [Phycisphaeraceae bacterium]|nr:SMC-Scp complex subunit ScpB [Phycisphaerae bacterium]MBX3391291.1 SMC-Scp complex subunit ScpB [Phycisphaeraceae bacterium]HRJ49950.1 SMC-Scp complex subunit ScpB [Phycisphaerales bacterium]